LRGEDIRALARQCGFELAGVAAALPHPDADRYHQWTAAGHAGEMRYLTDRRAAVRDDPRHLLPSARSVICAGKLYNTPWPYSTQFDEPHLAWISRYAWGGDYHDTLRRGLEQLTTLLHQRTGAFESRICVDTAPLLERSFARTAGLGWIGRNTCLINQGSGSWFFLGELLVSLDLPADTPPPDRCGTCTRCIDACPTAAILPEGGIDSRLCISYFTIELRGAIPASARAAMGAHVFGCDICQDVCPWNRRAPFSGEQGFQPQHFAPDLNRLAALSEAGFRDLFRQTPIARPRYTGFLRNVAIAMGNTHAERFRPALLKLAESPDPIVAESAAWALMQLTE
jgi:epoxyqueuosine reductase